MNSGRGFYEVLKEHDGAGGDGTRAFNPSTQSHYTQLHFFHNYIQYMYLTVGNFKNNSNHNSVSSFG